MKTEKRTYKNSFSKFWPEKNYKHDSEYCKALFNGVKLEGKTILDVGGGDGVHSMYAKLKGSGKITVLEPEFEGSTQGVIGVLENIIKKYKIKDMQIIPKTFQDFKTKEKYDIILLNNSINHLNEDLCTTLHKSKKAQAEYLKLMKKLDSLLNVNGIIVVADCSKYNFWNEIGLKSPFANTIEWHKHQAPSLWTKLLNKTGFERLTLDWTMYHRYPPLKFAVNNLIVPYFINSHFRMVFKRKKD